MFCSIGMTVLLMQVLFLSVTVKVKFAIREFVPTVVVLILIVSLGRLPGVPGKDQLYETKVLVDCPCKSEVGYSQVRIDLGTFTLMLGAKVFWRTEIGILVSQELLLSL